MKLAGVLAIAVCAPACQLVFTLDTDKVPHVPEGEEDIGDSDLTLRQGGFFTFDTTSLQPGGDIAMGEAEFEKLRQDGADADIVLMRVAAFTIEEGALFRITGEHPLVILANTIKIDGVIDASASLLGAVTQPGPGGGAPGSAALGEGGSGNITAANRN
nr:hypothetical protein [Deltaproteobacteria bacterium]